MVQHLPALLCAAQMGTLEPLEQRGDLCFAPLDVEKTSKGMGQHLSLPYLGNRHPPAILEYLVCQGFDS